MICVGTVATCTLGEQILLQQCATMCWLLCAFNDYPQSFFYVNYYAGAHPMEDHCSVRRQAAALLATIAAQFSAPHHNLVPRLCRVLVQAFLDPSKHLTSKYGAVVGLQVGGG
jgi:hypothetical protein